MTDTRGPGSPAAPPEDDAAAAASERADDSSPAEAQEIAGLKDRLLRALAEMENLRRRTEREVADARHYGIASFARDILGVADNMQRAMQALDAELREKADSTVQALLDGVELTERELLKVLEKHGIKKIEPLGEKFDPHFHQAMYEVPDASAPAGSVVQVVQPGYVIGDRMLRPALVAIAKGGPKVAPEAVANDNAPEPPDAS
jgi:molecular chaperone GrpE